MSEEGPSGRVNQRGRPMVLLPRVNAQNTKTQIRMSSVVHDVLLHLSSQECMWFGGWGAARVLSPWCSVRVQNHKNGKE